MVCLLIQLRRNIALLLACCLAFSASMALSNLATAQNGDVVGDVVEDVIASDQQVDQQGVDPLPGQSGPAARSTDPRNTLPKTNRRPPFNQPQGSPFQQPNGLSNAPIAPSPTNTPAREQPRTRATPTASSSRTNSQNDNPFSPRLARVPYIMGDFFGRSHLTAILTNPNNMRLVDMVLPNPSAGDIVGRVRLQDNNSPLPRDRFYFDYSFFHNVPMTNKGLDLNRYSPGIEKTFWDGMASVEVRVPMASTLDSNINFDLPNDLSHAEFGNVTIAPKFLLTSNSEMAVAAGMGVSIPTADKIEIDTADGSQLLSVPNDSAHLIPYLACLYAPTQCNFYAQAFLSFDFDTSGNPVYANIDGAGLQRIGTWQDQHLAALSIMTGSWLYRDYSRNSCIDSIRWSAEVHYTATLNDADSLTAGTYVLGNPTEQLSLVNGTFGTHTRVGRTIFSLGYSTPFTSSDRVFDGELRFFINRFF